MLKLAFDALLNEVKRESPVPEGTEYVLKTQLVLRSSTAFPADSKLAKSISIPKYAVKAENAGKK